MKNKVDLLIVTKEPFPIGMAATNRIISYAIEIAKYKNVLIYIPKPTEKKASIRNRDTKGKIGHLHFEYANNTTVWPKNKNVVVKMLILMQGYLKLCFKIFSSKPKSIIVYTSDYVLKSIIIIIGKITSANIILEENEYPKILNITTTQSKINKHLKLYDKFDGMIVMTKELKEYYGKIFNKQIFILPMTVYMERFIKTKEYKAIDNYFLYVGGSGGFKRDGVENIIYGFSIFSKKHHLYKLIIIGPFLETSNQREILNFISQNGLTNKIIFKGEISSELIPEFLRGAKGILMTPQENYKSGGFPTKLGEFLASGVPVISTAVSDIPKYLNNNNSYLIEPGNDELIADALESIVLNPIKAGRIGENGRKTALLYFSGENYTDALINFLNI